MQRLSTSSMLVAGLCLCAGASFADADAAALAPAPMETVDAGDADAADSIELDAPSVSVLQQGLGAWLVRSFETAGLTVRVAPQGVWGLGGRMPSRVRAVIVDKTRHGEAWQVDVSLVRAGTEDAPDEGTGRRKAMARFRVAELVPVWVAATALRKGEALACDRVRQDTRSPGGLKRLWHGACADMNGLAMRRSLMPGDVLRQDDMGPAFAVRDKSETTVMTRMGRIEVSTTGVALADADVGAKVPVRLNGHTQVIQAVVIGPGMARLDEGL